MGEGFYGDVLGEGEREEYERARGIGGIDEVLKEGGWEKDIPDGVQGF